MSILCSIGLVACISLAGVNVTTIKAEEAVALCSEAKQYPAFQFDWHEAGAFTDLGYKQGPGAAWHIPGSLIALGFKQLRPFQREEAYVRRFETLNLCRQIEQEYRINRWH